MKAADVSIYMTKYVFQNEIIVRWHLLKYFQLSVFYLICLPFVSQALVRS